MTATVPTIQREFATFRVPRVITLNGGLRKLSGDSLRVFLYVSFRCYRRCVPHIQCSYLELSRELDMHRSEINDAIHELKRNQVLHHVIDGNLINLINFYLVHPDNSRVQNYLHPPRNPAPAPADIGVA